MFLLWEIHKEFSRVTNAHKRTSQLPVDLLPFLQYTSSKRENINHKISFSELEENLGKKKVQLKKMRNLLDRHSLSSKYSNLASLLNRPQITTLIEILSQMKEELADRSEKHMSRITSSLQSESKRLANNESERTTGWLKKFPSDQQFQLLCSLIRWTNPQLLSHFIDNKSLLSLWDINSNPIKQYELTESYFRAYENLAINCYPRWIRPNDFKRWSCCSIPSALEIICHKTRSVTIILEQDLTKWLHKNKYLPKLIEKFITSRTLKLWLDDLVNEIECVMAAFVRDYKADTLKDNFVKYITLPRKIIFLLTTLNSQRQEYEPVDYKNNRVLFYKLFHECQLVTSLICCYKAQQQQPHHCNNSLRESNRP